jgi:hypothetical protein
LLKSLESRVYKFTFSQSIQNKGVILTGDALFAWLSCWHFVGARFDFRSNINASLATREEAAMSREVWGTFSVRDHLVEHAFVADVLLYDRLLVPTKPEGEDPEEWPRQWELARLNRVLGVLGNLAIPIPWTRERDAESKQ